MDSWPTSRFWTCRTACSWPRCPPGFGQLTTLQTLDLSGTQLTKLPPDFGQLASLQTLSLSDNPQLAALPAGFGQLTSLQTLNLPNSMQLTELPAELRQLHRPPGAGPVG